MTAAALTATAALTAVFAVLLGATLYRDVAAGDVGQTVLDAVTGLAMAGLIYGSLVYLLARWGHYRRHLAAPGSPDDPARADLFQPGADPGLLTILVPTYREDLEVVRQTALSAALQQYPDRRVVILVDDPPDPSEPEHAAALAAVRALPDRIQELLAGPADPLIQAAEAFDARYGRHRSITAAEAAAEAAILAALHERTGEWLDQQARTEDTGDHTARLFVALTFTARAAACRERARELTTAAAAGTLTVQRLRREHHRLARMFAVEVTTFERKRYVTLSHAPNKAMNLNAYIGLIGRRWQPVPREDGLHLEPAGSLPAGAPPSSAEPTVLEVPASRWLLTVDADSLLVHDYAERLVQLMQRPEHARTAVVQTPYSAVPGAPGVLERTAGATTDIMHMVHQGSTYFDATFWVGANALLRRSALDDIASTSMEGRRLVTRYIQDRTVIEDTESTVDLVDAGWRLHNYPDRLAYSATPADFGALLIQRRRWANGGLIILPKLLRSYRERGLRGRVREAIMRVHYLVSIAAVCLALSVLMLLPFSEPVPIALLVATSLPYFSTYARDLRLSGRRRRDLVPVYALNLLLFPVNLVGVLTSLRQALSGKQIPFGRTPKVSDRTSVPALYVVLTLVLLGIWSTGAVAHLLAERYAHGVVQAANAVILSYATVRFIGLRNALADLIAPVRTRAARGAPGGPVVVVPEPRSDRSGSPAPRPAVRAEPGLPERAASPARTGASLPARPRPAGGSLVPGQRSSAARPTPAALLAVAAAAPLPRAGEVRE